MNTLQKQHILVVDDDRQIARLVRQYLEQAGYGVLVVVFTIHPLTPQFFEGMIKLAHGNTNDS